MPSLSPDTDRRLVECIVARGLATADLVASLASSRTQRLAAGQSCPPLAGLLVQGGFIDNATAEKLLEELRAHREDSVGPYEITAQLGRGGMGRVLRGRHRVSGVERAIKVLDDVAPDLVVRFRREAEALARVAGERIVPVHEFGTDAGRPYYVMSILEGGSLQARIAKRGAHPWREAAELIGKLARTLERCHEAGLIHRDLKPANVLFDDQDEPRIADFGCARDLQHADALTRTGELIGTPQYMAPEQIKGERATHAADVWALGVILYELVTGVRPHEGTSVASIALAVKDARRTPLRDLEPSAPAALEELVESALALEPAERPSPSELARSLDEILAGRAAARGRRALALVLASLAVLVLGGTVAAIATRGPSREPPTVARTMTLADALDALARGGAANDAAAIVQRAAASREKLPADIAPLVDRAIAARPDLAAARKLRLKLAVASGKPLALEDLGTLAGESAELDAFLDLAEKGPGVAGDVAAIASLAPVARARLALLGGASGRREIARALTASRPETAARIVAVEDFLDAFLVAAKADADGVDSYSIPGALDLRRVPLERSPAVLAALVAPIGSCLRGVARDLVVEGRTGSRRRVVQTAEKPEPSRLGPVAAILIPYVARTPDALPRGASLDVLGDPALEAGIAAWAFNAVRPVGPMDPAILEHHRTALEKAAARFPQASSDPIAKCAGYDLDFALGTVLVETEKAPRPDEGLALLRRALATAKEPSAAPWRSLHAVWRIATVLRNLRRLDELDAFAMEEVEAELSVVAGENALARGDRDRARVHLDRAIAALKAARALEPENVLPRIQKLLEELK